MIYRVAFRKDVDLEGRPGDYHLSRKTFESYAHAKTYADRVSQSRDPIVMLVCNELDTDEPLEDYMVHNRAISDTPKTDFIVEACNAGKNLTGDTCSICHLPQFTTTSGRTCPNGHGGALPAE